MAEENLNASIKTSVVETSEETFKPGLAVPITAELVEEGVPAEAITETQATQIFAQLEPEEQEASTFYTPEWQEFYRNFIPAPYTTYKTPPEYEEEKGRLVINIETTGILPFESRLICIGVLDPALAEPAISQFMNETEEATIQEFVDWINSTGYTELISYNVAFDYRFLYTLMQRYRLVCPSWTTMRLFDLQTQQKQVQQKFVPGQNKPGTLEQWSTYLLGTIPYAEQKQVFAWLKEGNIEEILKFNEDKVIKSYMLYTLNKVVEGTLFAATGAGSEPAREGTQFTGNRFPNTAAPASEIKVNCPNCMQEQYMPRNEKVINCFVCGAPIASPLL